ncbi:DegV family protein [Levilactobacillus bambusae]|nr:DegV family protein [Levilactobacillus bambusae]
MKTAVVTTSSAYLTAEQCETYGIKVIHAPVLFGNRLYQEGVDLDSNLFYRLLKTEKKQIPTPAQASMDELTPLFTDLAHEGYEDVIIIGLAGGLSGFINTLTTYAQNVTALQVWPWDSYGVCASTGYQALLAGQLAQNGLSVQEILARLSVLRSRLKSVWLLDSLRPLSRTGQINLNPVSDLLKGKPILTFTEQGQVKVTGSARFDRSALNESVKLLGQDEKDADYLLRATVVNGDDRESMQEWLDKLAAELPNIQFEEGIIGPYVGTLMGSGAMGLVWGQDWKSLT